MAVGQDFLNVIEGQQKGVGQDFAELVGGLTTDEVIAKKQGKQFMARRVASGVQLVDLNKGRAVNQEEIDLRNRQLQMFATLPPSFQAALSVIPTHKDKLKVANGLITASEIAGTATGILSPLVTGMGESTRALLNGKSIKEAGREGARTAAVDTLAMGAFATLKAVKGVAQGTIRTALGPNFSEKVVKEIIGDISLTKPLNSVPRRTLRRMLGKPTGRPSTEFASLADRTALSVKNLLSRTGRQAGAAKAAARATEGVADLGTVKKALNKQLKEARFKVPRGEEAVKAQRPQILKQINEILGNKRRVPIKTAEAKLASVDELLKSKKTFLRGETKIDDIAKSTRGALNQSIDVATEGFKAGKAPYSKVSQILDNIKDEGIDARKAFKSNKKTQALLRTAMTRGNEKILENLEKLDDLLPKNRKFLRLVKQKAVAEEIGGAFRVRPGFTLEKVADLVAPFITGALRAGQYTDPVAKGVAALRPVLTSTKGAPARPAIEAGLDYTGDFAKAIGGSVNSILYKR